MQEVKCEINGEVEGYIYWTGMYALTSSVDNYFNIATYAEPSSQQVQN